MKTFAGFLFAACSLVVLASPAEAPVSQAEAATVFRKVNQIMKAVLLIKTPMPIVATGSGSETREQVLKEFIALYDAARPKFKFTGPPQKTAPGVISLKDPQAKQLAVRLEVLGFIDRYGPLATSKSDTLAPDEFGDAVGYFIARVAELSHTPTTKFSPYLMPP